MQDQFLVMPDDGMDRLIEPLRAARHTIDIYVFTLSNAEILGALREAAARGVTVRALVDPDPSQSKAAGKAAHHALKDAGAQAQFAPGYFQHLHAKSYVVDSSVALISSVNYLQDWERTRDFGLITADAGVVQALGDTFAADWQGHEGQIAAAPPAPLVLSPNNSRAVIADFIASAQRSLLLEEEQITDLDIVAALAARSNAGVNVELVTNAAHQQNEPPLATLRTHAPAARVRYSSQLWMHAKLLIADGERMLMGSVNLTPESLDKRREVSILITAPEAVARAVAVVQADLAACSAGPPDPESAPRKPADSPAAGGQN
jgi:cardiolipin synthase